MTKAELVNQIAMEKGYDKTTILNILEAAMNVVKKQVATGEDGVYLRGFGTFQTKTRASKMARNIKQNTSVFVPEHKIAYFKPSPDFNDMVRG